MHEIGICRQAVDIALAKAEEIGAKRITVIRLRLGKMAGVVPEALEFAFEAVVKGTIAEGAELVHETVPIRCRCDVCQVEFEPEGPVFRCPQCDRPSWTILAGREIELAQIEVE